MVYSLWSGHKRPTWSITFCFLTLFMGFILIEIAHAEDKEPLLNSSDDVSDHVIGIDFGTSFSRAGVMKNGKVETIVNDQGYLFHRPLVVLANEKHLISGTARSQIAGNRLHTIFDVKRLIGRSFNDTSVQNYIRTFPFDVVNEGGRPQISIWEQEGESTFTFEEISAMRLVAIKEATERYLGEPVKNAVIAVPAYFNDAQRASTKEAGTMAGLNIHRVFNEPTAAALAYGLDKIDPAERHVLIYDLGKTLDVSILTVEEGIFDVISTVGGIDLGGEDFNDRVVNYLTKKYNKKNNFDVTKDGVLMERLRYEVEEAKHKLSFSKGTKIEIESFYKGVHFSETLTRSQFEALNKDLFENTLVFVNQVLKDSGMKKNDIDDIILVGGSTRIPKIQSMIERYFEKKALTDIIPEEAVATGAAILGDLFADESTEEFICCCDINPLSLGIEIADGATSTLLMRGTILPANRSRVFSTSADSQPTFVVKIVQGQRFMAKDNLKLAEFELSNITLAPRGVPQIEVTFELDINRTLRVSATDRDSGNSRSITISDSSQIYHENIDSMVEDAEHNAEDDIANRGRFESLNRLRNHLYDLERQIREKGGFCGKLGKGVKQSLLGIARKAQSWLDDNAAEATLEDFEDQLQRLFDAGNSTMSEASCLARWCWSKSYYWLRGTSLRVLEDDDQ